MEDIAKCLASLQRSVEKINLAFTDFWKNQDILAAPIADKEQWLAYEDAARYTKLSLPYLRYLVSCGKIKYAKTSEAKSGRVLFKKEWLDQHLESLAHEVI